MFVVLDALKCVSVKMLPQNVLVPVGEETSRYEIIGQMKEIADS